MNEPCRRSLRYLRGRYPAYFSGPNVIVEFGSYDVNGSVREFFSGWASYTGLDWRPGPSVDIVCLAKECPLPDASADVAISSSMLEHDPEWRLSLAAMLRCLKQTGILILTWGGAYNRPHQTRTAIDRRFHPLPGGSVFREIERLGVYIHEFFYDRDVPGCPEPETERKRHFLIEELNLVGFVDPACATGERRILSMLPLDS